MLVRHYEITIQFSKEKPFLALAKKVLTENSLKTGRLAGVGLKGHHALVRAGLVEVS